MRAIRLCTRHYPPLDGVGASITGGRWNSPGKHVVYTASCGALAALEYLVHVGTRVPKGMLLVLLDIPESLPLERTSGWAPSDIAASRRIGDEWIEAGASPVLQVPSVLVPRQNNYLLNPLHPLFGAIKVIDQNPFAFDSRLLSSTTARVMESEPLWLRSRAHHQSQLVNRSI